MTRYVMGEGGGGGKGGSGGSARAAVEDPDSLQSHQYAKVIDLISEGEIGGLVDGLRSVYLNDTPIISTDGTANFTGVEVDYRNGTNTQSMLPGFSDVENETQVSVEVKHGAPIVRSITGDVDAARVTLGFPRLTKQDKKTGDLHGTSVDVSIEINNNGGGYKQVPLRYIWEAVSGVGAQIDVENAYGVGITTTLGFAKEQVAIKKYLVFSSGALSTQESQNTKYSPLTWRVEYKAPGGNWTVLKTESATPQGQANGSTYSAPGPIRSSKSTVDPSKISRTYHSPTGACGTWSIRIVLMSEGSVVGISGEKLSLVGNDIISGKTTTRYRRSYYIPLPEPGPWDIRVTRNTSSEVDSSVANETWWDSLAEVVESRLSYPNSAVVGLKIDAEQFSDIPTRGYEIFGIKCRVPSNYDPIAKTYSGAWNGTFKTVWTDNPAWVYYDLATNERYGLGKYIDATKIDKWALYEIGKYCDEDVPSGYGYVEPRFTCNAYIQTREEAFKLMTNLASVFRGMAYWSVGQVSAVADMPREASALFTNANVIDGTFTYSGSSRSTRHTVALVSWNDPEDMYRQKVEYVEDEEGVRKYGVIQSEIVAFACTSRGQARRMGKWMLYTERLESEIVSWKTGLEGFGVFPGAIVKVADNLRSGDRVGGRILAATANTVTLDAPVTLSAGVVYTISLVGPSGVVSDRTVASVAGTYSQLSFYPDLTEIPQDYSMWVLASANLNPQTMRILSVTEADATQVEVTALHHDPRKFEMVEYDHDFAPLKTSSIPNGAPAAPTKLTATDTLYLQGPGLVGTKCHVSWQGTAKRYEIKWKQFDGNFVTLAETTNSTDIMPVETGEIIIQVRAIDSLGRRSPVAQLKYSVLGKSAPPAQPLGFDATVTDAGIVLTWVANTELDMKEYEIFVNGQSKQKTAALTWTYPSTPSGTTVFAIKAIDTTGNVSTAATKSVTITAPAAPGVSYSFSAENVVLAISKPSSQLSIDYYEVFYTNDSAQLVSLGKTSATTFNVRGAWVGNRTFSVKATDIGGNTSEPGTVAVTIIAPPKPDLTAQVIDNNVLLFWTGTAGSLPIDTFEVRRGDTWATADLIGKKSGGFTTIFETAAGRFDYWVAAIDTAGNYSIPANRAVTVSQPPDYILKVNTDSVFSGGEWNRWNPSDIAPGLSDTVEDISCDSLPLAWQSVRAFRPVLAKQYWETTVVSASGGFRVGISKLGYAVSNANALGTDGQSYGWGINGNVDFNGVALASGLTYDSGDVVGLAMDASAGTLALYKNGIIQYTITGIAAGSWYPTAAMMIVGNILRCNFGGRAFKYPPPVGFAGYTNSRVDVDGYPLLPINTTETFEQHFSSRSWATPQAQVSAGYPMFAQPGYLTGSYEEVIDLGTILAAMKITLTYSGVVVSGSPTITTTISTKRLIGDAWTDNVGVDQFYGSAFQFVKIKIEVTGDDKALYKLTGVNTKLDAKLKSDAGTVACVSSDTKGTVVNFNTPFIDVTSVTLSPSGTTATTAVYDYYDSDDDVTYTVSGNVATITHAAHPYVTGQVISFTSMTGGGITGSYVITVTDANHYTVAMATANTSGSASIYPESMRVYLFNSTTGARVSGNVSWSIKGY